MANDKYERSGEALIIKRKKSIYYRVVKRVLDAALSALLLSFLWLPMTVIGVAIRIDSPGRAIFKQIRVGRGGRLFTCYKFRTMYKSAPPCCPSSQLKNAERYVTRVGRFLRRTSLDELPQLFNVLKGDMSLVGPRPLVLAEATVHEGRRERGIYDLRPGITGLSQVSGRDRISDEQKITLDSEYLAAFGFFEDLRIVGKTLGKVITGEGIKKS